MRSGTQQVESAGARRMSDEKSKGPEKAGQIVRVQREHESRGHMGPRGKMVGPDGLTPRQRMAVQALLQEPTIQRAAVLAGVNARTLRRWTHEPAFQRAYHAE